jgi:hypothetical protein
MWRKVLIAGSTTISLLNASGSYMMPTLSPVIGLCSHPAQVGHLPAASSLRRLLSILNHYPCTDSQPRSKIKSTDIEANIIFLFCVGQYGN